MGFLDNILPKQNKFSEWSQATQAKEKQDWTHFLSPEAMGTLRNILEDAYKHREAYFKAEDIKNAQLWSALIELQREIEGLRQKVDTLAPKSAPSVRFGTADDSVVLNKIKAIMQPKVEETKEATDALVNSLMKF